MCSSIIELTFARVQNSGEEHRAAKGFAGWKLNYRYYVPETAVSPAAICTLL
jgi:hypothetical protein